MNVAIWNFFFHASTTLKFIILLLHLFIIIIIMYNLKATISISLYNFNNF